eukprot:COSAG01_NODE_41242_length_454_cov_0.535211_1_plen_106_part_01
MPDAVVVESRPGRGRCAVAGRTFAAGELVWREQPLTTALHHSRWGHCCNGCHRETWSRGVHTVYCCTGCNRYMYCSEDCARADWHRGHAGECRLLQALPDTIKPDT